ncbi:hypothetical protein MVLG_05071 [Microbotryum lychnidis-dioicae p1A1 Lamole]|uniref:GOLD domain-containing protein n=1 Tax=Microbotryum lychnidis-dioicae (strain p1A1 Lamole / MvSl-1064) TaxID=683840 RepID=U5HD54_USTV1|nr:hypothetical protein MVLG_05071 [Microbotryum lychnidis-dioicae p1A1 Lamole]|eukprot:KDE04505.1 hypothetical protein MVLG_05071 [Microbotryum lychnidis-dioicae p1A1 Lamole]
MKWTVALFAALAWVQSSQALYFYLEAGQNRCFLEELPKDTIVVGHYKAEEWQDTTKSYIVNDQLGIQIVVSEVESGDKVVNTRGLPQGKFTFTSHEAGDHTICLRSNYTGGWFSTPQVRMHLDIAVGEAKVDEEGEREHVKDLAGKVKDLNHRLADIRREQQFQREREAEFRVLSETTNSRAVWWSVLQLIVLLATCIWQVRHLRHFFESKKLSVCCAHADLTQTILADEVNCDPTSRSDQQAVINTVSIYQAGQIRRRVFVDAFGTWDWTGSVVLRCVCSKLAMHAPHFQCTRSMELRALLTIVTSSQSNM